MLQIALTGGIASGKTSVSDEFAKLGVSIIDADIIAREVVAIGAPGLNELISTFGSAIRSQDGSLDRAELRRIIFGDEHAKQQTEAILHPKIRARSADLAHACMSRGELYCIHAIPLLVETKQSQNFDRVLVVDVPVETQIKRLQQRDAITREQCLAIINRQASREERLAVADDIIDNDKSLQEIPAKVKELHTKYQQLAAI